MAAFARLQQEMDAGARGAAIGQRNLGDPGLPEMSALRMRGKVQASDDFVGGQIDECSLLPSALAVKTCSPDCRVD